MTEGVKKRPAPTTPARPAGPALPPVRIAPPATAWRVVDALLAVALLASIFITDNLGRMPQGLHEFLAIRITIKNVLCLTAFGLAWPGILSLCGLYSPARLREGRGEWPRLILASMIGGMLALAFPLTSKTGAFRPEHGLFFALAVIPAAAALRGTVRAAQRTRQGPHPRQIVLVGSGPLAKRVYQGLLADALQPNEVIGFVDWDPQEALGTAGPVHLGGLADLEWILMHRIVDNVFIGLPIKSCYEEIQLTIAACERVGIPVKYPADLFRTNLGLPHLTPREATPIVLSMSVAPDEYWLAIKRVIDIVGALALLVLLSPVMLMIAAIIKLRSPGPALFAQERYGYMKRRFRMYKFRTMEVDAEQRQSELEDRNEAAGPVFKIRNDPRLTRVGRFLRRSSLDELPQLWNVLNGEMSLVGPRPLSVRDVGRFAEPWLMRRFSMRPGLTCLWQISGRSDLTFDRWIALDLEYIDRWSLWLDLRILLLTPAAVMMGRGAA